MSEIPPEANPRSRGAEMPRSLAVPEDLFYRLLQASPEAILITDLDTRILFASDRAAALFGFSSTAEIAGAYGLKALLAPEERENAETMMAYVLSKGSAPPVRLTLVRRDGSRFLGETSTALIGEAGNPTGFMVTVRDVTRQKLLEDRLQIIYELGQDLALRRDQTEIIQKTLAMAARLLGVDMALCGLLDPNQTFRGFCLSGPEAVLQPFSLPVVDDQPDIRLVVARTNQTIHLDHTDAEPLFRAVPGTPPVQSVVIAPLSIRGKPLGVLEVGSRQPAYFSREDISTLQVLAGQASVALENVDLHDQMQSWLDYLMTLFELAQSISGSLSVDEVCTAFTHFSRRIVPQDETWIVLREPDSHARIAYTSNTASGIQAGDIVPVQNTVVSRVLATKKPVLRQNILPSDPEHVEPLSGEGIASQLAVPLRRGREIIGAWIVESRTAGTYQADHLVLAQLGAYLLSNAIHNAQLYRALQDQMQKLHATQAYLVQTERMAALGRLMASIAHEINNPVQAASGFLELLQEELDDTARPDKIRQYARIVEEELDRVAAIVHRMRYFFRSPGQDGTEPADLDFVHFEATAETQIVDVHGLLENVLQLTRKKLEHSGVSVERQWEPSLPPVQAEPGYLKQAFLNLVLNAVDAMPGGGVLQITTRACTADLPAAGESPQPAVQVIFSDTGTGIPDDVLPHIFEPMVSTKSGGTGFGLFTCYQIVSAHRGRIEANSRAGRGSTFTVTLPVTQPSPGS
ncbi:MAG: GAF domain-containing protein [Chloroflexi bacterium]|nr:MAG: GAF domain-containing protein [Chloroflexota bacterium]